MVVRITLIVLLCSNFLAAQHINYKIIRENEQPTALVFDLPDNSILKEQISVRLSGADRSILGNLIIDDLKAKFKPLIPFSYEKEYEIIISGNVLFTFLIGSDRNPPEVVQVYPFTDTLPSNFLKFYIAFDQPMTDGNINEYFSLIENGELVKDPFLELDPPLWNEDNTILTLWIDPGRVKRDLGRNKRLGEVLKVGERYKLEIRDIPNSMGRPMEDIFTKEFYVSNRDTTTLDISRWKLSLPNLGSDPLIITFDKPLAVYLASKTINIIHNNRLVDGDFKITSDTKLYFIPKSPWEKGNYHIEVEARLEDLAGNNLNRLFDRDISRSQKTNEQEIYTRQFSIE